MAKKSFGAKAFAVGIVLALILGVFSNFLAANVNTLVMSVLILLGLIVGFFNITEKETGNYLMAAVSLFLITTLGKTAILDIQIIGSYLAATLVAIMAFVMPAVIVVATRAIYRLSKD
jgi:hypothetical protein